jgi:phosphonopyruvate decarboxylase
MIEPRHFLEALKASGIRFVCGVPDSLLKDVCACITSCLPGRDHVIATNEGSAVGLAIGHYLATGEPALVYMQNAGLGNIVNPITSLADPQVYGIPMILMIGWRAEMTPDGRQLKDEPQHVKQGQVTLAQLELLGIPYRVIDGQTKNIGALLQELRELAESQSSPAALVVRKNTFAPFQLSATPEISTLSREAALTKVVECLPLDIPIVATTGMISRELFELRTARGHGHERDFLTVGGMGHASQIAAGMALSLPRQRVACLDGDGAVLMHAGALAISACCSNLIHIVLNNGAHDSVGGQPTRASELPLAGFARAAGYKHVATVDDLPEIANVLGHMLETVGPAFLEIKCRRGARPDLGRPDIAPTESKRSFIEFLQRSGH